MIWSVLTGDCERGSGNGYPGTPSDELEKAFGGGGNDGGTSSRVFGTFLSWMQDKTHPVFVVATANDVSRLPPEMLRAGRFDAAFFSDLPDAEDRSRILNIHLSRLGRDTGNYNVDSVANVTVGFSGAELEQIVIDSLYVGFSEDREPTTEDLIAAANDTVPLSKTMSGQIDALRKWADARARYAGKKRTPTVSAPRIRRRSVDLRN